MTETHTWTAIGVIAGYLVGFIMPLIVFGNVKTRPLTALMIGLLMGFIVGLIVK